MNEDAKALMLAHKPLFDGTRGTYTPNDFIIVYSVYNLLTGQKKKDTGCSSCRRATVTFCREEFKKIK